MNIQRTYTILDTVTANENGDPVVIENGGLWKLVVCGTFDTATAVLNILGPDGSEYVLITGASFTAAGVLDVELPAGATVRAAVSSVGAGTSLHASLSFVR